MSVPRGIGANRSDAPRRRLLRFAPSTPPGPRQVRNEDVRSINMAIRRERRFAENRGLSRHPAIGQVAIRPIDAQKEEFVIRQTFQFEARLSICNVLHAPQSEVCFQWVTTLVHDSPRFDLIARTTNHPTATATKARNKTSAIGIFFSRYPSPFD